jgi:hypothetical protein
MVDFAKIMQERRERMTPEELTRSDAAFQRQERAEAGAADIEARFERHEWGMAPRPRPVVPTPVPARRSALFGPATQSKHALGDARARKQDGLLQTHIADAWTKTIRVRIEESANRDGSYGEVIRFLGGPTGHEAYRLDADFCAMLVDRQEREKRQQFYICAGTPGSYYACHVAHDDVMAYVHRMRPHMFADAEPASAPGMSSGPRP